MRSRTLLTLAALTLGGALPAVAQSSAPAATPAPSSSAAPAVTPSDPWPAKPVARYDLHMIRPDGEDMPVSLTISDSAGTMSALFWPVGDQDGHTMAVTVNDTDLVLNGQTPGGPLVITLHKHDKAVDGKWSFRGETGTVKGTIGA